MDTTEIKKILIKRGYQEKLAEVVAKELMTIDNRLVKPLSIWLEKGEESEVVIDDVSLKKLMFEKKMKYPAALLTMDWMYKEPEVAIPIVLQKEFVLNKK
ncbi:MAG: hypothetical protein J6T88_04340 [Bacteroidales bacterium]|nr:hypothetical protein [Bacteroidales bacterium]